MSMTKDPFETLLIEQTTDDFDSPELAPGSFPRTAACACSTVSMGRLHGFDLDDRPLITAIPQLDGEIVTGRSTVPLRGAQIGERVVLVFEGGDVMRPIILGVLQDTPTEMSIQTTPDLSVDVLRDGDKLMLTAERQITLQCGEASITLTRAGKVLITGKYILSRSSGHHRIKGAAVDIN